MQRSNDCINNLCISEYIRGYNSDGEEVLWIVTSGNVNTLALFDINNDSKNEVKLNRKQWKSIIQLIGLFLFQNIMYVTDYLRLQ